VLVFNERQIRNKWYDGECAEATKVKNDAYLQMLQKHRTRSSVDIYKARRREEKYIIQKKKTEYEKQRCEEVKLYTAKEIRQFYQNINRIRKEFKPNSLLYKDKRGNITADTVDILERWAQHFEEVLNPNNVHLENHIHPTETIEEKVELDRDEMNVELAFHSLTNGAEPFLRSHQLCSYSRTS
jgi:hypothetical protein